MAKFYTNVINEKDKELNWKNQNFCYAATILIVVIIFALSKILSNTIDEMFFTNSFWNCFLMSLYPNFSMIMFGAVSLYLERKYGSIKYFLMVLMCLPMANIVSYAFSFLNGSNFGWAGSIGFSCVAFIMAGIFITDFIFSIKYHVKNKLSFILPILVIIVCIIFMCINLPDSMNSTVYFDCFGRLIENSGHYGPFAFGIFIKIISQFMYRKEQS